MRENVATEGAAFAAEPLDGFEDLVDPEIAYERLTEFLVSGVALEAKCVSEEGH